jgi:hypothetical protein
MTDFAKGILDALMEKINSNTAVKFVKESLFSDGVEIPCRHWSTLNRFITFYNGTQDARGIRQWNKAGRKVKKGSNAFYIFVPMLYPLTANKMRNRVERRALPDDVIETAETKLTGFKLMPVFAVEDTEGEPLEYEERMNRLKVEALPLIDVAKRLGVSVKTGLMFDDSAASYSHRNKAITLGTANEQVFLHELSHAVDNELPGKKNDYAYNEVVAELSSAFLGSLYGVNINIDNTKAYINSWKGRGHVAFKVADALERVEQIYKHILKLQGKPPINPTPSNMAAIVPSVLPQPEMQIYDMPLIPIDPIKDRTQTFNPLIDKWIKRNSNTGLFCSVKKNGQPFSRVEKEETIFFDNRMAA